MKKEINTIDLFCGAGGASTGLGLAIEEIGAKNHEIAINHWKVAVATMKANHPDADVREMDIESAVPSEISKAHVIDLLWASPSCTHHSRAKGGKPRDNQMRAQPELILTWLDQLFVRRMIVENVPEIQEWGPLTKSGNPDRKRVGDCFRSWVASIEARGYRVEWRVLCCADYGDATTRRRFFLQAVKIGCGQIRWPEPTHSKYPDLFGKKPWRGFDTCIDYNDLGRSAFHRKHPLSQNTIRRLMVGVKRYFGNEFQIDLLGMDKPEDASRVRPLTDPLPTQHAGGGRTMIARPYIVQMNNHCTARNASDPLPAVCTGPGHFVIARPVVRPLAFDFRRGGGVFDPKRNPVPTITTKESVAVVTPLVVDMSHPGAEDGGRVRKSTEPLATATTRNNTFVATPVVIGQQSCSAPRLASEPAPTVSTKGAEQIAFPVIKGGVIVDILVRMAKPRELAFSHSFDKNYVLTGTKTQQIAQIGNSVPVFTAKAMCLAALKAS